MIDKSNEGERTTTAAAAVAKVNLIIHKRPLNMRAHSERRVAHYVSSKLRSFSFSSLVSLLAAEKNENM